GWVTPFHVTDTGLEMLRSVRREGGRTVLSGSAGDLFMGNAIDNSLAALDELLLHWRPAGFIRELRSWSKATHKTIWALLHQSMMSFASVRFQRRRALWAALTAHGRPLETTPENAAAELFLLRPAAVGLWKEEILRRARCSRPLRERSRMPLLERIEMLAEGQTLHGPSEFPGLSMTFPYAHRPLAEFITALPPRLICAPGRPRALMHDAVDSILPDRIRRRFSKGYAAPLLVRASRNAARRYRDRVNTLALVTGCYVDAGRLGHLLDRLEQGACRDIHNLTRIMELELWLESSRGSSDERSQMPA
ncbi:MAG TPA: asparagine synthase-related protein, partial [Vicinamibacterales bacterium]